MRRKLCIYHANCLDGYGAYMAVQHAHAYKVDGYAASYGKPPPMDRVQGRDVFIVDFSYPYEQLLDIAYSANSLLVLDHHKSAQKDLTDRFWPINTNVIFDMNRSGAMMSWEHFNRGDAPPLIKYIQDRDLWRWQLPRTAEVTAALFSYPFNVSLWHDLMFNRDEKDLVNEGMAIRRDFIYKKNIILQEYSHMLEISGHTVPAANAPGFFASEVGNDMAEGYPFAAVYSFDGERYRFSLRSREGGVDVSEIAKSYGGGGHERAAGFNVESLEELKQ